MTKQELEFRDALEAMRKERDIALAEVAALKAGVTQTIAYYAESGLNGVVYNLEQILESAAKLRARLLDLSPADPD
jgi:hypothetical protein